MRGDALIPLTVGVLKPFRALALSNEAHGLRWVWQFGLYPRDERRRRPAPPRPVPMPGVGATR
jgi:hypothetical protein